MEVVQINLQTHLGGGEVYTAFLCRALAALGVKTRLVVADDAAFWRRLDLPENTELIPVRSSSTLAELASKKRWMLTHGASSALDRPGRQGLLTAIAHMPVQGRDPRQYAGYDMIFPVSGWVREGLLDAGLPVWPEPLYGIAANVLGDPAAPIFAHSVYAWDRRKVRERVASFVEPYLLPLRPRRRFSRRSGLTLGIVSRLTPIKQFPLLFHHLVPRLAARPRVFLEIFGAGGYASVRDTRAALRPLGDRVRFWGFQSNLAAVYANIDYLLTGLPEKEALGLNVLEAQATGVPVIAPAAPPFTETVIDGVTGFLYRDPRQDRGEAFAALLDRILAQPRPDPRVAQDHLARFGEKAFEARLSSIVAWAKGELGR